MYVHSFGPFRELVCRILFHVLRIEILLFTDACSCCIGGGEMFLKGFFQVGNVVSFKLRETFNVFLHKHVRMWCSGSHWEMSKEGFCGCWPVAGGKLMHLFGQQMILSECEE